MTSPETSGKDSKSESNKTQAVGKFMVPVTVAWLLAVAGIVYGNVPTMTLLNNAGLVAIAAAGALAFLTVVLSAFQDLTTDRPTQWLLFPEKGFTLPSHRAFTEKMLKKAKLSADDFPGLDISAIQGSPEAQDRIWFDAYNRNRAHPAIAHFSTRHVAWRDTVPLLLLLTAVSAAFWAFDVFGKSQDWLPLAWITFAMLAISWLAGRHCNIALVIEVLRAISRERKSSEAPTPLHVAG